MADLASLGDLRGKRVLVRSDLNVPLDGTTITDDGRIRASVPTISSLAEAGARVIVCAHLGRPKGAPEERYSLAPVVGRLAELLGRPVTFATDTVGESARAAVAGMSDGDVVLLENLRFNPGETAKTDEGRAEFADALAGLADAYVSDGFGVVHRKQASVYDVATRLPSAMGGLVRTEVEVLKRLTEDARAPVRRGARRREGRRQARRHRQPDEDRRPPAHRRRHALHLPRGPGPRDRHEPVRRRQRRRLQGLPRSAPRRPASRSCCRSTSSAAGSSPPTPRPSRSRPTPSPPT